MPGVTVGVAMGAAVVMGVAVVMGAAVVMMDDSFASDLAGVSFLSPT